MGQYFTPITFENEKGVGVYNHCVQAREPQFGGYKLTEHSWWYNEFPCALCAKLHRNPAVVAWVGDYCESDARYEELSERWRALTAGVQGYTLYELQAVSDSDDRTQDIENGSLTLDGKYLVNHTQKVYVDGSLYREKSEIEKDWIVHPLSILTAIGNGAGGGDYYGMAGVEFVGTWALDLISVEDAPPEGYTILDVAFFE